MTQFTLETAPQVLRMPFMAETCREGGIVSGQALAWLADTAMVCGLCGTCSREVPQ